MTRDRNLGPEIHRMLEPLIDGYLDVFGAPPGFTRRQAKVGIIELIERGAAHFIYEGTLDDPKCAFRLVMASDDEASDPHDV